MHDEGVDGPHVPRRSTGEEKKGDLEHDGETLYEQVEWPPLEAVIFALAVTAAFDHRSTCVPEVPVQPLFAQHRDERRQQRHQKACIEKVRGCNDLCGKAAP